MIKTRICELLNIEYPIFQGGMAWIAESTLAAAVSNAGGLGVIAGMNGDPEYLRAEIRKTKELTSKPFGVNIMLMSPYAEQAAQLVIEEQVPVVTTGAGSPGKFMQAWLAAGIKVVPVVPSVAFAKMAAKQGAAAVIAEGCESGGHIGELTTMTLVPQVCDAVSVPVLAAGGIADGRGVAASMMLGAEGVQLGTRFLVAEECTVHETYKEKVLKAKDIDTIATGKRLGHAVRSLKTPFSREYLRMEYDPNVQAADLEKLGAGALRLAACEGDTQRGCFMAGQSAGMVHKRQTCAEIIAEIFSEAEGILADVKNKY
ncbi:MAG: enoyl-[acyl-carrier-protein] reductase FabK [Bacillota bacterium]|jgi:enoyl-[acyl-carrier protein] reductase II